MKISRRDFLKTMGIGAAAAGLGSAAQATPGHARTGAETASMPMPKMLEANFSMRLQASDPTDPLAARTVQIAENMEPVIPHDAQAAEAKKKLAALEVKTGKKPNILILNRLKSSARWAKTPPC